MSHPIAARCAGFPATIHLIHYLRRAGHSKFLTCRWPKLAFLRPSNEEGVVGLRSRRRHSIGCCGSLFASSYRYMGGTGRNHRKITSLMQLLLLINPNGAQVLPKNKASIQSLTVHFRFSSRAKTASEWAMMSYVGPRLRINTSFISTSDFRVGGNDNADWRNLPKINKVHFNSFKSYTRTSPLAFVENSDFDLQIIRINRGRKKNYNSEEEGSVSDDFIDNIP